MNADYSDFCQGVLKPIPAKSEEPPLPPRQRAPLPTGGESAGFEIDGDVGEVRTGVVDTPPRSSDELLLRWDLDPAEWEVIEPYRRSSWEQRTADGEVHVLNAYRARIQRRRVGGPDVEALMAEIRDHAPHAPAPTGELAFVVAPADLQCGKGDPEVLIRRFLAAVDAAVLRLQELRDMGRKIGSVYILFAGDLIENVQGYYASQSYTVTLNLVEQLRVVRRLMVHIVKTFAPLADSVVLVSVPGNHDESSRSSGGKNVTDAGDSHACGLLTEVADILAENEATYGHVRFMMPPADDPLVATLDVCGTGVAVVHGHQFPTRDGHKWWQGQAAGMRPAGNATVMYSGHYHHLRIVESGPRLWVQVPSLDVEGSAWWAARTGEVAPTGVLTMVVGGGSWQDVAIH